MAAPLFGTPIYSDPSAVFTPTFAGGSWSTDLPLTNLQDRRLALPARSVDAAIGSTRFQIDLKTARRVGVIAIPKHTLSTAARVRILGRAVTPMLFDYEAGDDITALGATYSRASTGWYFDERGILRAAGVNGLRDAHFIGGERYLLLEMARTNSCLQSRDLTASPWGGTATAANTATGIDGAVNGATVISDSSTSAIQSRQQTVTVPSDSNTHAVRYWIAKDAVTSRFPGLELTLSGGTTGVSAQVHLNTVTGGVAVIAGSARVVDDGLYWCVELLITNNGTGNTALGLNLYPAIATVQGVQAITATGSVTVGNVNVELAAPYGTSPMLTGATAVTRQADSLVFPFTPPPQEMTVSMRYVELGTQFNNPARFYWCIGQVPARLQFASNGSNGLALTHNNGTSSTSLGTTNLPSFGNIVDARSVLAATGATTLGISVNGGAESALSSSVVTLAAAWSNTILCLNSIAGAAGNSGTVAIRSFRVAAGTQSQAAMQAAVYDSGYLDAWPVVYPAGSLPVGDPRLVTGKYSAEEAAVKTITFTHVPPAAQTAQLWEVQILDATNAAGYVDLARLVLADTYQPGTLVKPGAQLGMSSATTRQETDGGAAIYAEKPRRREVTIGFDNVTLAEAMAQVYEIQQRLGTSGQLYFVFDPADTANLSRRSFLCVMRATNPIELAAGAWGSSAFDLVEEL